MDQTVAALFERIERLEESNRRLVQGAERTNRRLRAGGVLALVLCSAVALLGWNEGTDRLSARVFSTENNFGSLRQFDNGMPVLWLQNPNDTTHNVQVSTYPNGETSIAFWTDLNKPARLSVGIGNDGHPFMLMRDDAGNMIWQAP
jgi:hypothetical protein